jgi:threonine/homoserine/homoserine lactone efflux protein
MRSQLFLQGVLVQLLNPKIAIFVGLGVAVAISGTAHPRVSHS